MAKLRLARGLRAGQACKAEVRGLGTMNHQAPIWAEAAGQATFGMANLRQRTTGLPFIVFISQRDGASHGARVKVSQGPKVRPDQMGTYSISPFDHKGGLKLSSNDEARLKEWIDANLQVLKEYWDGDIDYTEDVIERLITV